MGGTLTFDPVDVARLIVHAADAPQRRATWTQKVDEGARRAGIDPNTLDPMRYYNLADSVGDDYDPGPALTFVKDTGIYLMSNGTPPMDDDDPSRVIYAARFDPANDTGDQWSEAVEVVGGDDFAEPLTMTDDNVTLARHILAGRWVSPSFTIVVDDDALSYGFDRARA